MTFLSRMLVASVLVGALTPTTLAAGSPAAPRQRSMATHPRREPMRAGRPCPRTFTVGMAKQAARAVYRGTRRVRLRERRMLGRLVRCQRVPVASRYVRWYVRRERTAWWARRHPRAQFTGYTVSGTVSTFGPPIEGGGTTADGGTDYRPCIALRDTSTLGRMFLVTIAGHSAKLLHCDSGPWANGRSIDVTGAGAEAMGLSPYSFPTDSWGTAQELR